MTSSGEAAPPSFVRRPSAQRLVEGGSVVFQCQVAGNPRPHVIWKKSGVPLTTGYRCETVGTATGGSSGAFRRSCSQCQFSSLYHRTPPAGRCCCSILLVTISSSRHGLWSCPLFLSRCPSSGLGSIVLYNRRGVNEDPYIIHKSHQQPKEFISEALLRPEPTVSPAVSLDTMPLIEF